MMVLRPTHRGFDHLEGRNLLDDPLADDRNKDLAHTRSDITAIIAET